MQRVFDVDAVEAELAALFTAFLDAGCTVVTSGLFDITVSPYVEEKYRKIMSERIAQLQAFPGAVLYNAANDLSFIVYLFGSGILQTFYGLLGSSVFLLRRSLSTSPDDYRMVTSVVITVMRLGLGCVAGIIVGWLAGPSELSSIKDLANGPFVLAFIAGFSIDIVFSVMDRIILAFDPLRK